MEITVNVKISGLEGLTAALEKLLGAVSLSNAAPRSAQAADTASMAQQKAVVQAPIASPQAAVQTAAMQAASGSAASPQISVQPMTTAVPVAVPVQVPPQAQPAQQQPDGQSALQAPAQVAVPTAPVGYTQEQLALAAAQLMDAGRTAGLQQLLASFGAQALTQLPKEHYGAFATQLRALGAKL